MAEPYVAVVGAINIDMWGKSSSVLILNDSNPGVISYSLGGVGRNIAHNLSLLGQKVSMLTAIGDDHWSSQILRSCEENGIDLSRAFKVPGSRTGTYLALSGPDGDMAIALSDMAIADEISPEVILRELDFLNGAACVVIDGNLRSETICCICENVTAPIFADPVSVTKGKKFLPYLHALHTFKPNSLEAETLTDTASPEAAAKELIRRGVKRVFVSDGSGGIVVAEGEKLFRTPCRPTTLVNATGGGDAVMAAICDGHCRGCSSEEISRRAMAAGSIAVESADTISPLMSQEALLAKM
ncbi:MAG: carbohydrate kinase family protein [Oscillospiraceae bacterium]|nr:carbohydrate kinase family protein [Oscillospiraceae bacterium]